jgi:hypothetical protein
VAGVIPLDAHLLTNNCGYQDVGSDYFVWRDTDRQRQWAVAQFQALGYRVALEPMRNASGFTFRMRSQGSSRRQATYHL